MIVWPIFVCTDRASGVTSTESAMSAAIAAVRLMNATKMAMNTLNSRVIEPASRVMHNRRIGYKRVDRRA